MSPYNLTMVANQSGIVPLLQQVNSELMFGWYGNMILVSIGVIALIAFTRFMVDPKKATAAATFIVFISSIFLRALDLVGNEAIYLSLVISAIAAAFLYITK